jgi:hypothetical protein
MFLFSYNFWHRLKREEKNLHILVRKVYDERQLGKLGSEVNVRYASDKYMGEPSNVIHLSALQD